ncbi:oxygenase MpaB family protein [Mycobacterium sp. PDNC021]|uniref:oxygenase MpaB family protein n=1 Tax=Mycobacterium sp. PDNC021 TaxID=3391399 RepID=UPI003AB0F09E
MGSVTADANGDEKSEAADRVVVLTADEKVGKNLFPAGTRLPDRSGDGSLRASHRVQRPVPPQSLTWKYMADFRCQLIFLRAVVLENLWPQLAQGVSDHSQVFGDKDNFYERGRRGFKPVVGMVYGSEEDAGKFGLQVRNYHKSVKGEMPGGQTYHAINPETYYWAHVTFYENIIRTSELLLPKPFTRAEREQIFEESKEWFSLYGVDDRAQPSNFDEFEAYFEDVLANQLVDSSLARYSVGFARAGNQLPAPPMPKLAARVLWPRISSMVRLFSIGAMEPEIRSILELEWNRKDERNFRRLCAVVRKSAPIFERLPLKYRYFSKAVEAFDREGIDPRQITLESARVALAEARQCGTGATP